MSRIRKTIIAQLLFLTLGFVLAYGLIRRMPVQACDILHYGQFMNEVGEVEFCGAGEADFFDTDQLRYPVIASLTPQGAVERGHEASFRLSLVDYQGLPMNAQDIAVSHTQRIHLMAVDPSLEDYQHIHPQPTGAPGEYTFSMTPRRDGRYAVYLDFIPIRSGRRVLLGSEFATGVATAQPPPRFARRHQVDAGGLHFILRGADAPLQRGQAAQLQLRISDGDTPVTLEPVMNSWAHLVAFDPARNGFAHLHPLTPYIPGQTLRSPDALDFTFVPDKPGNYRLWAQVQVAGRDVFAPFDLLVE